MIQFERKFLYCFADIAAAKELIGKEGLFFDDFLRDKDLLTLELKSLVDVLLPYDLEGRGFGRFGGFVFENNVDRYKFFYCDPNLRCKRAFYLEGKEIQSRVKNSACKDWNNCPRPIWEDNVEYRIKPEETLLTYREVAQWTSQGKGQLLHNGFIVTGFNYLEDLDNEVICDTKIRKWSDSEWHEPTREYVSEVTE